MITRAYETFPDGTPIDPWFYNTAVPTLAELGRPYRVTDYGALDDGRLHPAELQALIDRIAAEGGGVMVVPAGVYMTGALFFKQGVSLYLSEGAMLRGSDDIAEVSDEDYRYFNCILRDILLYQGASEEDIVQNSPRYQRYCIAKEFWDSVC